MSTTPGVMANKSEDTATQPDVPTHHEEIEDTSSLKQKFFFGARGKSLTRQISFAGAIGFMLFGYDQGVLGVCAPPYRAPSSRPR